MTKEYKIKTLFEETLREKLNNWFNKMTKKYENFEVTSSIDYKEKNGFYAIIKYKI